MAYDSEKILRAKIFWYLYKLAGYSASCAFQDLSEIRGALDGKRQLDMHQSAMLTHASARQFSEKELADAMTVYERLTSGKYSVDIVNAILAIPEKES